LAAQCSSDAAKVVVRRPASLVTAALSPPGTAPDEQWFEVCLIPETLKRTTLGTRAPGEVVNLEVDVIAKYVERLMHREDGK
jgi:riboflavin synthase alpha subunit